MNTGDTPKPDRPAEQGKVAVPLRTRGSWIDIRSNSEPLLRVISQAQKGDMDADRLAQELTDLLLFSDFSWPALEEWARHFASHGVEPGMWDESLLAPAPLSPIAPDVARRVNALSREALITLARGPQVATIEQRCRSTELPKDVCERAIAELESAGFAVRPVNAEQVLERLGLADLRVIQRARGLPGARSKDGVRKILLENLCEQEILAGVEGCFEEIVGRPEFGGAWMSFCYSVGRVLGHTLRAEAYANNALLEAEREGYRMLEVSSPGDGFDRPCEELDGKRTRLNTTSSHIPHFPGCRCVYLFTSHSEVLPGPPVPEPRGSRRPQKAGCSFLVAALLAVLVTHALVG